MADDFMLETFVDFVDDALDHTFPITEGHIDNLMARLASVGFKRVSWAYYADARGGYACPAGIAGGVRDKTIDFNQNQWDMLAATYAGLGNPLRVATEAAHRHGLELFAYYKPYETGIGIVLHEGSSQAAEWGKLDHLGGKLCWLDPFVIDNPDLRIKRRTDDLPPGCETATITTIELAKQDDRPTRITPEHLQFWFSENNDRYQRADVEFDFEEVIRPCPREVRDIYGNLVTKEGDLVRVLRLTNLSIDARYFAIATDFQNGEGDFTNAWDQMLTCFDAEGREIPGVYAAGTGIWFPHWESLADGGMYFDTGRGPEVITLDEPAGAKRGGSAVHDLPGVNRVRGAIAFCRGRNAYLPGALCETEPRVQAFWLDCMREMLDAGVDGIELRAENHSTHTDTPEDYGFNDVVMERVDRHAPDLLAEIGRVRGDAYTQFVRDAKSLVASRGKTMRINLNVGWFRPPDDRARSRRLAFPANIDFNWRQWVEEGLLDAATLRVFGKPFEGIFGDDPVAQEMIAACNERDMPVTVNQYISHRESLGEELLRVRRDGRFAGFIFYEVWHFMRALADGSYVIAESPEHTDPREVPMMREHRASVGRNVKNAIASYHAAFA